MLTARDYTFRMRRLLIAPRGRGPDRSRSFSAMRTWLGWSRSFDGVFSQAFLGILLVYAYAYLHITLFRTWYFNSDEYVFAAEVVRFLHLDFRQQFFDIPGTVYMMLNTLLWAVAYTGAWLTGHVAPGIHIVDFTFQNISSLFVLLRSTTLAFFLLSAILLFVLVSRVAGRIGGALASLFLVMSPTYTSYSSFVRTESMAMVFILGGLLILVRGVEKGGSWFGAVPSIRDYAVLSGILAGIAAGARLHAVTAVLPAMVIMLWLNAPREQDYPEWARHWLRVILPTTWLIALATLVFARRGLTELPGALRFLTTVVVLWLGVSVAAVALYHVSRTRPLVVNMLSPAILKVVGGAVVGFFIGNPTIITQYPFFLQSVQMYSQYVDPERMQWSLWRNLSWYVPHYVHFVAPNRLILWLFIAGAVLIVFRRDRRLLPFLAAALLFFVSKPLTLYASPHHVVPWLPFFFVVCAFPLTKLLDEVAARVPSGVVVARAVGILAVALAATALTSGPKRAMANGLLLEDRLRNIGRATEWIKQNTPADSFVAVAYTCFNSDIFYAFLKAMQVPVPQSVLDGRSYLIWWGNNSAIRDKSGYACATREDIPNIKTSLDLQTPGEGTDPYSDGRFSIVASFGDGDNQVDLFRFSPQQVGVPLIQESHGH